MLYLHNIKNRKEVVLIELYNLRGFAPLTTYAHYYLLKHRYETGKYILLKFLYYASVYVRLG